MKTTRQSGGCFLLARKNMFEKKFNNHSIVGAEEAGVVKKPVKNHTIGYKYQNKLRLFLNEYQYGFNEGRCLPAVPPELKPLIDRLRFLFHLECDNIENIIKAACRMKINNTNKQKKR